MPEFSDAVLRLRAEERPGAKQFGIVVAKSRSTRSLQSLLEESTPLEQALDQVKDILCGEGRPLTTEASGAIERINTSIGNATREIAEKKEDVSRIEHGNSVSYPRSTKDTLEYLRARISKAQPEVLCDLVTQVRDETWQNAIEGWSAAEIAAGRAREQRPYLEDTWLQKAKLWLSHLVDVMFRSRK